MSATRMNSSVVALIPTANFQPPSTFNILSKEATMDRVAIFQDFSSQNPDLYLKHCTEQSQHVFPSQSSMTAVQHSDIKSFDVEADMAEALMPSDPNARPKNFRNTLEEFVFVFTVMMCSSSTTFLQGVTIINTATIGKDLNMTAAQTTWISASLGLSSGSFVLFFGKTADLFGRKVQLIFGLAFLSLFALITAFAPNGMALDVLLGFLGLGTAAIAPPAVGILFAIYSPGRRRNKATGALGCGNPLGFVVGSISSGLATKYSSWRASFIVVAIFFLVMTAIAIWTVPAVPRAGSLPATVRQFDYLGTMLTVMGMAMFSAALTEGPAAGWKSPKVIAMLTFGLALLFGFAIWENIYTHPLLDPSIWKNRNFNLCILCVLFGYMSFITNQFWISLYMQDVQMLSPLLIAARLLPQTFSGILWSYSGQWLVSRVSGTFIMGLGALAYVIGATLLIFIRQHTSYWWFLFPSLFITVMGADYQFIVANLYINTQMPDQASLGAGVLQTAMRLSISLGLAITAAVYGSTSRNLESTSNINLPYERAYLCSILFAVVGVFFIPFMRIGKQGGDPDTEKHDELLQERPQTGGEYSDRSSREHHYRYHDGSQDHHSGHEFGNSTLTVNTMATIGSQQSYFPRWSWEEERQWNDHRFRKSNIVYEVCIKCLEERRIVIKGGQGEEWQPLTSQRRQPRHAEEGMQSGYTRLHDEGTSPRLEAVDQDRGIARLTDEQRKLRQGGVEVGKSAYTQLPDERREPRPRVERAWQRFPVKPTRREDRSDILRGGDGWL